MPPGQVSLPQPLPPMVLGGERWDQENIVVPFGTAGGRGLWQIRGGHLTAPRELVAPNPPSCTAALKKPSEVPMQCGKYKLSDVWGTPLAAGL